MTVVYDFSDSSNWALLWEGEFTAEPSPVPASRRFLPIPEFEMPIRTEAKALAIYVETTSNPGTWFRGGFISQRVRIGLALSGLPDANTVSYPLKLNTINVFEFPKFSTDYTLRFRVPFWFE